MPPNVERNVEASGWPGERGIEIFQVDATMPLSSRSRVKATAQLAPSRRSRSLSDRERNRLRGSRSIQLIYRG